MFCPVCGGSDFEQLFGGRCSKSCVYCGKAIYCRKLFADEIEKDSLPIKNPIKAALLRLAYNKIPGNKEKGEKNIAAIKAFRDEIAENARQITEAQKRLRDIGRQSSKEFKKFDGTLKEFLQQIKEKNKA